MKLNGKIYYKSPLCEVKIGWIFKFKGIRTPILRVSDGYCELGDAFDCVEMLDRKKIDKNTEIVNVYGKLKSLVT